MTRKENAAFATEGLRQLLEIALTCWLWSMQSAQSVDIGDIYFIPM